MRRYRSEHDLEREADEREQGDSEYRARSAGSLGDLLVLWGDHEGYDPDRDDPNRWDGSDPYDLVDPREVAPWRTL